MKKTIKSLLLVAIMSVILLALTGCGGNKLVATKSTEDEAFGKYEEKIEISFKDDKANEVVWTMEFEDAEKAKSVASVFDAFKSQMEGFEVEHNDKKVTLKMDAKVFADQEGIAENDESMSKESMKKSLEEDGYKVK